MKTLIVPTLKPRNRFVVAAKFRRAGRMKGPNARQAAKRELQKEVL